MRKTYDTLIFRLRRGRRLRRLRTPPPAPPPAGAGGGPGAGYLPPQLPHRGGQGTSCVDCKMCDTMCGFGGAGGFLRTENTILLPRSAAG